MDIRNFFSGSRKRKNTDNGEECVEPAKKKRKLSPKQETSKNDDEIMEEKENEIVPSIQSLDIKKSESPCKGNTDNDDQKKRLSDDDEDEAMEDESDYDDDIDTIKNSNSINTKLPSIILSKTKEQSLKESFKYDVVNDCGFSASKELPYSAIATMFDKLGNTTKRLEKVEIMSRLFRSILHLKSSEDDKSLLYAVYLCCNEIAPPYDGLELGIGDSIIMKALCESTGRKVRDIKTEYTKIGDLGDVAVQCRSKQNVLFKSKPLTAARVFETFKKIAKISGSGTQQQKVRHIQGLFVAAKGGESRYIVRHLQGRLRIGVNEQTVLAALGWALAFDQSSILEDRKSKNYQKIADLENEYSNIIKMAVCQLPNYDMVIGALLKHGIENLNKHCHLTSGIPIKAMLAKPTKGIQEILKRFENMRFTLEYKYDGERAQIHLLSDGTIKIFSRNAEDNTAKFPELLEAVNKFKQPHIKSFIIDSEIVAYDRESGTILPFSVLITRKRKNVSAENIKVSVCIYAFDCLLINDEPLISKTFYERREALYKSCKEVEGEFCFAHHRDTSDPEEISEYLNQAVGVGKCEGLMVKTLDIDATYEPSKRSHNWLKCKKDYLEGVGDTLDLVVFGAFHGTGKRTGTYGSYLVGCYNEDEDVYQSCCKVGTGFKDEDLADLDKELKGYLADKKPMDYETSYECDVWFEPKAVWELKCADFTISATHRAAIGLVHESKGIALRFPRFIRKRDDKLPNEATSAEQIAEMYQNQAIFN